ncbi:MAG: hypothetical protein ACJ76J_08005 [Thermoanaerobaculia bacterium]
MRAAQAERQALDRRYQEALAEAGARGAVQAVQQFEAAVQTSKAVIARPLRDIERLASSDRELYPTFYGLLEGEIRDSFGDEWDDLRGVADAALFPRYQKHIRFAALSLDGIGLDEFGDCSLVLREDMIAHRASGFEENSASFVERHHHPVPEGFRSTWEERSKLCTAKHAKDLQPGMPESELPTILLRQKAGSEESGFVEVHIYGPISVHAIDKVILRKGRVQPRKAMILELRDRLAKVGVSLEMR